VPPFSTRLVDYVDVSNYAREFEPHEHFEHTFWHDKNRTPKAILHEMLQKLLGKIVV
jgi:hypothetical protein